ncbi:MAG TPA: agmatinase [Parachlamydiaceae bacterium]|nr:agmatinase [Parachlamydiaceae bacterium]
MEIGQGHGEEGRFAGLPDPYGSEEFAKIVILPVPFDKTTTYQKGSDLGPEALIEASRNMELYDIETDSKVYLHGIYTAKSHNSESSEEMLDDTYNKTKALLAKDKFVVVVGGEHAISYAPIKAHAEHFGKLTVLQFDAHADLQPAYEGNPWSHASVMARVREIPQVQKSIAVGIRSMSDEELPLLERANTFFAHELDGNWIDKVLEKLEGPVYITFDLDAFDCSLMPSTGTPEPGGLLWNQAMGLLKRVFEEKNVVGCDVVELCPNPFNLAPDYVAAKLIYKILSYKFKG